MGGSLVALLLRCSATPRLDLEGLIKQAECMLSEMNSCSVLREIPDHSTLVPWLPNGLFNQYRHHFFLPLNDSYAVINQHRPFCLNIHQSWNCCLGSIRVCTAIRNLRTRLAWTTSGHRRPEHLQDYAYRIGQPLAVHYAKGGSSAPSF